MALSNWLVRCFITFSSCILAAKTNNITKPHIIIIMADDMGFHDLSFHGSDQVITPNIDALSAFGVSLNRYYVAPMCSPSRSSLMTGKYPSEVGMQHFVIPSEEPWGLGLNEKLLPEYMKEGGYQTHLIGKWHLGLFKKNYTPLFRGFDSHVGYLGPYIDYYNHSLSKIDIPWTFASGYDMRKNLSFYYESKGIYATDLFTSEAVKLIETYDKKNPLFLYLTHLAPHTGNEYAPLQAPAKVIKKFSYIKDINRRTYAAMVYQLDVGVGKVVQALKKNNMLDNSIILFFSDNGSPVIGQHSNAGSNYPFRGQKDSPWEGAVRSGAAIWSKLIEKKHRVSHELYHISDWLPTFAHLADVKIKKHVSGKNIWESIAYDKKSPRDEVLCNLDDVIPYSSLVKNEWKFVNGTTYNGKYDGWLSAVEETEKNPILKNYGFAIINSEVGQILSKYSYKFSEKDVELLRKKAKLTCNDVETPNDKKYQCNPLEGVCLFNILLDPCERINLAKSRPDIVRSLAAIVEKFRKTSEPARNRAGDPCSNPLYFNNTWTYWCDELSTTKSANSRLFFNAKIQALQICMVCTFLFTLSV